MSWKQLSTKIVYRNQWMEVTEDEVETDLGTKLTFGIVHKKPFALIIPWDGTHLTLVGQYRYATNNFSWEFPAGHLEYESIEDTARHELQEETGLRARQIKKIASFDVANGYSDQVCSIFFATELVQGDAQREAAEEGMEVKKVTASELKQMIKDGNITDGPTITAFGLIMAREILECKQ